jgi:hypothetical protein
MKIKCKCDRVLVVPKELAGKKIACKHCGQRYRLPPAKSKNQTVQMTAWKDDEAEHAPAEVGAVALGQKLSLAWLFISVIMTLIMAVGGAWGLHYLLTNVVSAEDQERYAVYIELGLWWGPVLACLISGWITARMSPGLTIAEPAIGAALSVALIVLAVVAPWEAAQDLIAQVGLSGLPVKADAITPPVINVFGLAMFLAACVACTGAYFGEVAQHKRAV